MITQPTYSLRQRTAGLLMVLLFAVFAAAPAAHAQSADNSVERLTLSPVSKRVQLKSGSQISDNFTVINDGQTTYDFKVYASPYYVKNEQYEPLFDTSAGQRDASTWVQFKQSKYTLQPGQRVDVPYTVLVPADAAPGGHYAVLFAETISKSNGDTTGVSRNKRVGSVLLANVEGKADQRGSIVGDATSFLQLSPPLTAELRVRNDGNVDFDAKVALEVHDVFGGLKYRSENTFVVFPETTRRTLVNWPGAPIIGFYKVGQTVSFLGKTQTVSKYVLIMPSWLIIAIVIALVAAIASFVVKRRMSRKR